MDHSVIWEWDYEKENNIDYRSSADYSASNSYFK
jgi:hypothetical protein